MNTPTMEVKPAVVSKQAEEVINGIVTQVVCSAFSDHILVVVTQYGKMGTLVSVTPNEVSGELGKPTLTSKVLLGCDEVIKLASPKGDKTSGKCHFHGSPPMIHVCAKNLVSFVSQESKNKPIILSIALKDKTADGIKALKGVIKNCQVW